MENLSESAGIDRNFDRPPVIIVGAGGHAKVVIELFRAADRFNIVGLIDMDPSPRRILDIPIIGSDAALSTLRGQGIRHAFVAVGHNETRCSLGNKLVHEGFELVNAISPTATISESVQIGRGIAIMAGVVVNAETKICDLAIINTGSTIDHDGNIGECAHVGPGCAIAGSVRIGRFAFLGVGVSVIPGISIGDNAVLGGGACVVCDIPAGVLAVGVPARVLRKAE